MRQAQGQSRTGQRLPANIHSRRSDREHIANAVASLKPITVASVPDFSTPANPELSSADRRVGITGRLGDRLVAEGLLAPEQLHLALAAQKGTRDKLGSILVQMGAIGEDTLLAFLSRQYNVPAIAISHTEIDPAVRTLIPAQLAEKHDVVPVRRSGNTLTLAMADPSNVLALDDVAFLTNLQIQPAVSSAGAIRQVIDRLYGSHGEGASAGARRQEAETDGEGLDVESDPPGRTDAFELTETADDASIVRLMNVILIEAIRRGVSDIHLEPYEKLFRVRFRIDGVLNEIMAPPKRLEAALTSRVKIMANLDIAERRLPQDGRIKLRYHQRDIDVRVATLPTLFGEKAVMRLLDREALHVNLETLGFDSRSLEQFNRAIRDPHGMILITGPTGSGKTTTLYSAIHAINSPAVNIMAAEDPVEYNVKGINQLQVNEEIGRTFAAALRSFLRQDPDVILLGETRDLETAQIAIRAALTGHLVLTTLHTNDCASTVARLLDMGIPPFLVSSALSLIVAQRLARRVCGDCREPQEVDEASLVPHGHAAQGLGIITCYRGVGCPRCHFTGLRGRVAIYEVMPVTHEIRDLILRSATTAELRRVAQSQGMRSLRQNALQKVLDGTTTLEEVLRVTAT